MADPTPPPRIPENLLIPVKLDAFIFNAEICNGKEKQAKIAPITQPNYTFLRLDASMAQSDIIDHTDIHNATPPTRNSRLYNIGSRKIRENRLGVYLHWMLPRPYRSSTTATDSRPVGEQAHAAWEKGLKAAPQQQTVPIFPTVPTRWLIIRKLDPRAETTVPNNTAIEPVKAWVVESDRMQHIDDIPLEVDLQVDVSPFITSVLRKPDTDPDGRLDATNMSIDEQAEVFIGYRTDAAAWTEAEVADKPRVDLTVTSSSNQLLADFQYHNCNVFSMLDTLEYDHVDPEAGQTSKRRLEAANVCYYVVGWHGDPGKDILAMAPGEAGEKRRDERIQGLNMGLRPGSLSDENIARWMGSTGGARVLCHGAMYDVEWDNRAGARPKTIPADAFCARMNSDTDPPIAVGSTPMDALLAYAGASHGGAAGGVEGDLWRLQTLLRAQDGGVAAQWAAADEVHSGGFARFDGGARYFFPDSAAAEHANAVRPPTARQAARMRSLNAAQRLLDGIARREKQMRWELFACWWKFIADPDSAGQASRREAYEKEAEKLTTALNVLQLHTAQLARDIAELRDPALSGFGAAPQEGVLPDFAQQRDPTLLIAGVAAGWPRDFQDRLLVRLDSQTCAALGGGEAVDASFGTGCLPPALQRSAALLVAEFLALLPGSPWAEPPAGTFHPLYHDGEKGGGAVPGKDTGWRDRWGSAQPWFPLFVEWEAQYIHIPYEKWALAERDAWRPPPAKTCAFGLDADITTGFAGDVRHISGRNLILPQPKHALTAHIDRLFGTVPASVLKGLVSDTQRQGLHDTLGSLAFLSCPLDGLTQHLTTQYIGTHVKPLVRVPGLGPAVLEEALAAGRKIKLDRARMALIDQESDPTPYGPLPTLAGTAISGFKPVTHGQMRFTKINVIDKFGQVIYAVKPDVREGTPPVFPCAAERHAPQRLPGAGNRPNVADHGRSKDGGRCEFIQLPPSINQPARLNASFVVRADTAAGAEARWLPVTEWQNPIWGWVVANYADRAIQVFLPDGTFYREARITAGARRAAPWLPFPAPRDIEGAGTAQLDRLVQRLAADDQEYLIAFMAMVDAALQEVAPAPAAYAQFASALVGRPLALVNMGWSLELSTRPKTNQSSLASQRQAKSPLGLLEGFGDGVYEFPVRLGDRSRLTDGLVGYFGAASKEDRLADPANELDLSTLYTHFAPAAGPTGPNDPVTAIGTEKHPYPKLRAFWLDPTAERYSSLKEPAFENYVADHNAELKVFGALVDPFLPVTAHTGILPVRTLALPPWTWESALRTMTAFFHVGPIIVTQELPEFNKDFQLKPQYGELSGPFPAAKVGIAGAGKAGGEWIWLQPYGKPNDIPPKEPSKDPIVEDRFMPLEISNAHDRPWLERGPYVAVEGYLQMKKKHTKEDDHKPESAPLAPSSLPHGYSTNV
ncbi:hypothetical protein DFH27DRAFT_615801 [Peziza echinospora]|nr:hypothetical protein DFH27DRAFT_615801 [Peziza echinospora]